MIKRTASRYSESQEPLYENSFKGTKGIDGSKSPTETEYIVNSKNLDVDYDGGLVLRKPIKICKTYPENILHISYMYDKENILQLSNFKIEFPLQTTIAKFICTDVYGITHTVDFPDDFSLFNYSDAKIINTVDTTIISNVSVNTLKFNNVEFTLLETDTAGNKTKKITAFNLNISAERVYRMLKLYKNNDTWCLEMLTPEANTMSGGTIPLDFNTTLDNPLAVQDGYFYSSTNLRGILAYRLPDLKINDVKINYTVDDSTVIFPIKWDNDVNYLINYKVSDYKQLYFWIYYNGRMDGKEEVATMRFTAHNVPNSLIRTLTIKIGILGTDIIHTWDVLSKEGYNPVFETTEYGDNSYNFRIVSVEYSYFNPEHFDISIDKLTESGDYSIISSIPDNVAYNDAYVLKAFLDRPDSMFNLGDTPNKDLAICWEQSTDGVSWKKVTKGFTNAETVYVAIEDVYNPPDLKDSTVVTWSFEKYFLLNLPPYSKVATKNTDEYGNTTYSYSLLDRADCLNLITELTDIVNITFRCTLYKLKDTPEYILNNAEKLGYPKETTDVDGDGTKENVPIRKIIDYKLSEVVYHFQKGTFEVIKNEFENPLKHDMLYWKKALYAYGGTLKNNIYASNVDSAVFPMSRIIDLGTYQSGTVNNIVPWKDYLIAFTDSSVHLIQEQEVGFTSKVINTFTGVSEHDAKTCVAVLNGLIFKSNTKVYMLLPNFNSGSDTIFNIAEISKPINHILENMQPSDYKPFAFTTSEEYYLFIPYENNTVCFKYDYSKKIWTTHEYPVRLVDYVFINNTEIRLFGNSTVNEDTVTIEEYYFNKDFSEPSDAYYGDEIIVNNTRTVVPIEYFVDSGQKAENLSYTKQFLETKILVATLTPKDSFKMNVQIDIEGIKFTKHVDLNTSGALIRDSSNQIITLGTDIDFTESDETFNTIRQMFLRYAGKGKTIRHIIAGNSLHKFKIYEVFYRYRLPHVKQ